MRFGILLSTATILCLAMPAMTLPAMAAPAATPAPMTKNHVATGAKIPHSETVEERIRNLHNELRITPSEEGRWKDVAQVMRENAARIDQMIAARRQQDPQTLNAKEDLKTYEQFAKAHVEGLKKLRAAFDELYDFMPPAQERNADQVFAGYGRKHGHAPAAQ